MLLFFVLSVADKNIIEQKYNTFIATINSILYSLLLTIINFSEVEVTFLTDSFSLLA